MVRRGKPGHALRTVSLGEDPKLDYAEDIQDEMLEVTSCFGLYIIWGPPGITLALGPDHVLFGHESRLKAFVFLRVTLG
jgi:hypothetical protein